MSNAPGQVKLDSTLDGTVELAHEALLTAWPRLQEWTEQAREVIYMRNRLAVDARHYAEVNASTPTQSTDELWSGTRLTRALEMLDHGDFATVLGGLSPEEETFLVNSKHKGLSNQIQRKIDDIGIGIGQLARSILKTKLRHNDMFQSPLMLYNKISRLLNGLYDEVNDTEYKIIYENQLSQLSRELRELWNET